VAAISDEIVVPCVDSKMSLVKTFFGGLGANFGI